MGIDLVEEHSNSYSHSENSSPSDIIFSMEEGDDR